MSRYTLRPLRGAAVAIASVVLLAPAVDAQYFGRNKVNYEHFDFRVLDARHFAIHYYPEESTATLDAARMAERWYARHSETLRHTFDSRPIVFYADHPDFQQTNVIGGFIDQGTGGVTESVRERVVMPFTGVYADNDHVLGHELVHVFQYDIAARPDAGRGLNTLPLWLIEGMAEYLSIGRQDPHTAMWLRDAALRNDIPTIKKLTTDQRYFPYRYGQALWAYIGGRWGDDMVTNLYVESLRRGWESALRRTIRMSSDSLSKEWLAAIKSTYGPVMQGRTRPGEIGKRLLPRDKSGGTGEMDLAPTLSPDGRYVAFFSRRGLFSIDLYVADANTGRIVKKLTGPESDNHFDALSFIDAAGSWSPDARKLAFVVFAEGDNEIAVFDVRSREVERRINVPGVGAISDVAWGPDGRIAFSGSAGGISDLYLLDLETQRVERLTSDRNADLQPSWSPDGRTIVFASDRGPGTDFNQLTYAPMRLTFIDVATRAIRVQPVFEGAKHINPQYSPDGRDVYFISDRGGFSDVYRVALDGSSGGAGEVAQVTRLATGISGITSLSPALAVAKQSGRMMFTVFDDAGYSMYRLEAEEARGRPVTADAAGPTVAGTLPPVDARGLVAMYLADPARGLPAGGNPEAAVAEFRVVPYRPSLGLEYIGTPGVGVAVGGYGGTGFVGGIASYFTDMLNNHVLGASIQAQGSVKDVGAGVVYQNLTRRWHWLVGASHTPYLLGGAFATDTSFTIGGQPASGSVINQVFERVFLDEFALTTQYPFSQTRRFELGAAYTYQWSDVEVRRTGAVPGGYFDLGTENVDGPPGLGYAEASAALVGDYSVFGFTSPVAGGRWRLEVSPTFGSVTLQTALVDYRRYLFARPFTVAVRGLHYGRYGADAESDRLSPLYIGQPALVRGYDVNSIDGSECTATAASSSCPELDRLIGSRIGVANLEVRIPLLGAGGLGLINFPYLPTEISPFVDAGVAWTSNDQPTFEFQTESPERVPVFSTGISARVNLFGYAVGELFYAYPFQRPSKGWHFGFQLAPGW
jgi:hypothetical protein